MASGFFLGLYRGITADDIYVSAALETPINRAPEVLGFLYKNIDGTSDPFFFKNATSLDHQIIGAFDGHDIDQNKYQLNFSILNSSQSLELDKLSADKSRAIISLLKRNSLLTFDSMIKGRFQTYFGVDIPLIDAPTLITERLISKKRCAVIYINDSKLSSEMLGDIVSTIEALVPDCAIMVKPNEIYKHDHSSDWMSPDVRGAVCHVHVGEPAFQRPFGRLIDSAGCQVPLIVFINGKAETRDANGTPYTGVKFLDEIHLLRATTILKFGSALRDLIHDVALRTQLTTNSLSLCREFNAASSSRFVSAIGSCQQGFQS